MNTKRILVKYGGNAMTDDALQQQIIRQLCELKKSGFEIILVHGGGPFIKKALADAQIESEFIDGHRVTTAEAMPHIEMALKGFVNGKLVNSFSKEGDKAIGISGKDANFVKATKRKHISVENGVSVEKDLGFVGDVQVIDTELIETLLKKNITPVVACIAGSDEGIDYNVNADMFAGHLAGALKASSFIVLTDVDGLMEDINVPESIVAEIRVKDVQTWMESGKIKGGMIPKLEACNIAVDKGASEAIIINGTKPHQLKDVLTITEKKDKTPSIGTRIKEELSTVLD